MELKDIFSLVFSAIALLGTAFTYFIHNRKLSIQQRQINEQQKHINEQQKHINDYELLTIEEQEIDKRKAFLQCTLVDSPSEMRPLLRVQNTGKATARNIQLRTDDEGVTLCIQGVFSLLPAQNLDLLYYNVSFNVYQEIIITWDDEFESGRKITQHIILGTN